MTRREIFFAYLKSKFPDRFETIAPQFQTYFEWLCEINTQINLISRQMPTDEYWTNHFLDSVIITEVAKFNNQSVVDFGTGGGLPGIPLAILYPDSQFHLLDARKKKLEVLADACVAIDIDNVELIHGRIEEVDVHFAESFDSLVCRSVKIEPQFKKPLLEMIRPGGTAYFYKSLNLDDMKQFHGHRITDVSREELGTRKIISVRKK